ncbi:MAG: septum formation initiator family protein [Gemmatimonadaceae bacterium]|nr:septum formation initiator family protein [Gemmatimonadaceae bacterium]
MPKPARDARWWAIRGLVAAVAFAVTWFAVQGGEYGTLDLVRQHRQRTALERRLTALEREVDSLEGARKRVLTDPVTQERIAREEFGMVRNEKELLYRFAPAPDSSP